MILAPFAFLALSLLGPAQGGGCDGYTVARGDTLYSIARRCGSNVAAEAAASGLADPRRIELGQRLVILGGERDEAKPDDERADESAPGPSYRFEPGDTLYSLARWARVSLAALIAANPGIDPHKIEIGDEVRLPARAADPARARARERGQMRSARPAPPPVIRLREPILDDDEAEKPAERRGPAPRPEPEPEGM
jgi:LysM repeat protein